MPTNSAPSPHASRPLQGTRVLDFTGAASGPVCTAHLAALGAEVIKIESLGTGDQSRRTPPYAGARGITPRPDLPDDMSTTSLKRNRGKKSLALDLKQPEAIAIVHALARGADVVIENFKPGVTARLGIDYADLRRSREDIVYCSLSGFGRSGPYQDWVAFDIQIQALCGVMARTGAEGGEPTRTGIAVGDLFGSMYATTGILSALRHRDRTGEGQLVEVSMFDCMISAIWDEPIEYFLRTGNALRMGNRLGRMAPWNSYATRNGTVVLVAARQNQWLKMCGVIGRPDLRDDPRFDTLEQRVANVKELDFILESVTRGWDRTELVDACQRACVPCAPVNELQDLVRDPHVAARGLLQPIAHPVYGPNEEMRAAGFPVRFDRFECMDLPPAPLVGQHSHELLSGLLGLGEEEIEQLVAARVVGRAETRS